MMFADVFTLELGDATVKGRRLTLKEIRANFAAAQSGGLSIDESVKLIRDHVTLADGSPFDPEDLTPAQMRKIVGELILPEEGRGISDFIGLLS